MLILREQVGGERLPQFSQVWPQYWSLGQSRKRACGGEGVGEQGYLEQVCGLCQGARAALAPRSAHLSPTFLHVLPPCASSSFCFLPFLLSPYSGPAWGPGTPDAQQEALRGEGLALGCPQSHAVVGQPGTLPSASPASLQRGCAGRACICCERGQPWASRRPGSRDSSALPRP